MAGHIRISIIIDSRTSASNNTREARRLHPVHGLSMFIEAYDRYILFDLGPADKFLVENSEVMGIPLDLLDAAIISHIHSSHAGALGGLGWVSPYLDTYIPFDSMQQLGLLAKKNGLKPIEVLDWKELWPYIYITPPIYGPPWEHFLIIKTDLGAIVFSGCTHPGINKVLSVIKKRFGSEMKIYAWIGGFHLSNAPHNAIVETINRLVEMKPKIVVPLHCSGETMLDLLSSTNIEVISAGIGDKIDIHL